LPFLLWGPVKFLWFYWRKEIFSGQQRYILLEIKMPEDALRPFKAMEDVFTGMWQMHDPANTREEWLEGKYQLAFALEIVSTEGNIHFYLRIPEGAQKLVESAIYAQYPSAELELQEDYTKLIPQDIPNKEWDLWGTNYVLERPSPYPIKTYSKFFEPSATDKEEMRVNPMALLVEGLSRIGKGEHIWVQFVLTPILHTSPKESTMVQEGREIVAEIVKRPPPPKEGLIEDMRIVGKTIATGQAQAPKEERQEIIPPEMRLTPGEREIVSSIEEKISKYSFGAHSRFIYIAKRENYFGPAKALPMSWFTQFGTATFNNFRPLRSTLTKVYTIFIWFMDKRRVFVRKRRLFRNYTLRLPPYFPKPTKKGTFVLNVEELATIFNFPGRITSPSSAVVRVGSKKGEAPSGLPME